MNSCALGMTNAPFFVVHLTRVASSVVFVTIEDETEITDIADGATRPKAAPRDIELKVFNGLRRLAIRE